MVSTISEAEHRYRLLLLGYYRQYGVVDEGETDVSRHVDFFAGAVRVLDLTVEEIRAAASWVLTQVALERGEITTMESITSLAISLTARASKAVDIVCEKDWNAIDDLGVATEGRPKLLAALQFIEQNTGEGIGPLCTFVGLSRSELTKIFSDVFNMNPLKFRLMYRIEKIKRLTTQGVKTKAIAAACGFKCTTKMYVTFRQVTGYNFGAWRKEMRNQKAVPQYKTPNNEQGGKDQKCTQGGI
jgi:AraC-like DNA-binding protein